MSRTTQALLKLQQSQAQSKPADQNGGESAIPASEETPPVDQSQPVSDVLAEDTSGVSNEEATPAIEIAENVAASAGDQTMLFGKVEYDAVSDADPPASPRPKSTSTLILNSKAAGFEQAKDKQASEATADQAAEKPASNSTVEPETNSATINFGADYRAAERPGDVARQAEEENSQEAEADQEIGGESQQSPVDDFDSDVFSLEPAATSIEEPFVDEDSSAETPEKEPHVDFSDEAVSAHVNSSAPEENSDEVEQLIQAFGRSPHSAVAGSTAWEVEDPSVVIEPPPEATSHEDADDTFAIEAPAEAASAAEPTETPESPTPPQDQESVVRVYGPRPEGRSIYHPLEELRDFDLEESAESEQLARERLLREQLQQPDSRTSDDAEYWAAKANRQKETSDVEPPPIVAPEHDPEEFAESVKMHRRPAPATAFDKWLDDRFDNSGVRQACTKLSDTIRETLASASGNSVLMVSSKSAKQVYQPVSITAAQLARQSSGDVLLIDGNLEARMLTEKICNQEQAGLSDALQNPKKWGASCHCWRRENLFVMPCGGAAITSYKSSGKAFASLMAILHTKYQYVLVDGGSVNDPFVKYLAQVCYGSLLVVKLGVTNIEEAKAGLETLQFNSARTLGCVTTNAQP